MKRISAIFLLSIALMAQTELHQVLKFHVLAQHFAEHKKQDPGTSVIGFIILHYLSGNIKDKDYEKDMQLPFKTADCATAFSVAITPNYYSIVPAPVFFETRTYPALNNNFIPCSHSSDIWQPPKLS